MASSRGADEVAESFRGANETLRARFGGYDLRPGDRLPFLCECAERRCTSIVWLGLDEYESVRDDPAAFVILPGHGDFEEEQIADARSQTESGPVDARFSVVRRHPIPSPSRETRTEE